MERQIKMTIEEAKKLYENGGDDIKNLLLTTFTKEELESPKKPKDWEDLLTVEGYLVTGNSRTTYIEGYCYKRSKNIFPKREQAEASLALAQLLQLMQHPYWNGDWEPNWEDNFSKFCVGFLHEKPEVYLFNSRSLLAFSTEEKSKEFLESYKDLIEIAKPLL